LADERVPYKGDTYGLSRLITGLITVETAAQRLYPAYVKTLAEHRCGQHVSFACHREYGGAGVRVDGGHHRQQLVANDVVLLAGSRVCGATAPSVQHRLTPTYIPIEGPEIWS
jgi:hypothetical protein